MEKLLNTQTDFVKENCKIIKDKIGEAAIKSGRNPQDVRFMAVTKTVAPEYINAALETGIDLIGENRVQEYLSKAPDLHLDGVEKHLIGHLQKNKVRQIVGEVDMIQSVDSVELAKEISKRSQMLGITTPVLIEVNLGNEESKFGFRAEELDEKLAEIDTFSSIKVEGMMTVPPICEKIEESRRNFAQMYKIYIDFKSKIFNNINMNILSMGMSADFEQAILEGSDLVRVGSALFGRRNYR